jgi:diguanylate cyclase (GGDEF)-like protein/PAS domain S-box-containing protein
LRSPLELARPKVLVIDPSTGASAELDLALQELGCTAIWHGGSQDDLAELVEMLQPDLALIEHQGGDDDDAAVMARRCRQLDIALVHIDAAAPRANDHTKISAQRIRKPFTTRELGLTIEVALQRQQSESDRRKRDEAWELVFDDGPLAMVLTLPSSSITRVNRSFMALSGYADENLIGRTVDEVGLHVDEGFGQRLEQALTEPDRVSRMELTLRCKDGAGRPVRLSSKVVTVDGTTQWLHLLVDLTDQKAAIDDARLTRKALSAVSQGVVVCDPHERMLSVNPAFVAMTGYSMRELIGQTCAVLVGPDTDHTTLAAMHTALDAGQRFQGEIQYYRKDGSAFWCELSIDAVRGDDGRLTHFLATLRDINERRSQLAEIQLAANVFALGHEGIVITNARGDILMVNKAFTDITGYAPQDVMGHNPSILSSGRQGADFYKDMWARVKNTGVWQGELWNRRKDGSHYPEWLTISAMRDDAGRVSNYIGTFSDLSAQREANERIRWLSQFDPVTNLPNRNLLADRCSHDINLAARDGKPLGLMVMGIDRFTLVNDTLGHGVGDKLLRKLAARLNGTVREQDTVARFGGDEFVLVLPGDAPDGCSQLAERLTRMAERPFEINDKVVTITLSIGIAMYPDDGTEFETLFTSARAAMRQAKEQGPGTFSFFNADKFKTSLELASLSNVLREAIELKQFHLNYQPFVDLQTGVIGGMEALLRWNHPELGAVSPARFIPVAEASGQIIAIGDWVLRQTCRDILQWQAAGLQVPAVSVNLSPAQFRDPALVGKVRGILDEYGIDASQLFLELTEGALMNDIARSESQMHALRALGVKLALDDFGTGYSSLSYLKRFPFDKVKIDQSFVRGIHTSAQDAVIAKVVISMAHGLGLRVIAEGVETEAQCEFLRANVCDEIQGYFFSRPIPMPDMQALLVEDRRLPPHLLRQQRKARTLLLVDDEPNVISALKRIFRTQGYQILTANSGPEGLELLARNPVDIIIADQRMPGMTGVEFLRAAKAAHPLTTRIVLSGHTELQSVTDAINEGAIYRFLTKPWDDEHLLGVIHDAFLHKELADENERLNLRIRTANQELAASNQQLQQVVAQKQAELATGQHDLASMQQALQAIPVPVMTLDARGRVSFANDQALQLCHDRGPLLTLDIATVLPEIDALLTSPSTGDSTTVIGESSYRVSWRAIGGSSAAGGKIITLRLDERQSDLPHSAPAPRPAP